MQGSQFHSYAHSAPQGEGWSTTNYEMLINCKVRPNFNLSGDNNPDGPWHTSWWVLSGHGHTASNGLASLTHMVPGGRREGVREFLLCFENALSFLIGQAGLGEGRLREDARLPGKFEVKD